MPSLARKLARAAKARSETGGPETGPPVSPFRVVDAALMRDAVWQRPRGLPHLRRAPAQPVGLAEALRLAAHLPILFLRDGRGAFSPVAVVTLLAGKDAPSRLSPRDGMPARYVPALAGIYPFVPLRRAEDTALAVDLRSGLVHRRGTAEGEPFGTPDGTAAPFVARVAEALPRVLRDHEQGRAAARVLARHNAFAPVKLSADDGVLPLHAANPAALEDLRDDDLQEAWTSGGAALLHAHLVSVQHMSDLLKRRPVPQPAPVPEEEVAFEPGGFLDALMDDLSREGGA